MKICYLMVEGRAKNVRFVEDSYTPKAGEIITEGATLPPKGSLDNPTPAQIEAELTAKANELHHTKLALAACLEVMFAFVKNPTLFSTAAELKQAVVTQYKSKL